MPAGDQVNRITRALYRTDVLEMTELVDECAWLAQAINRQLQAYTAPCQQVPRSQASATYWVSHTGEAVVPSVADAVQNAPQRVMVWDMSVGYT